MDGWTALDGLDTVGRHFRRGWTGWTLFVGQVGRVGQQSIQGKNIQLSYLQRFMRITNRRLDGWTVGFQNRPPHYRNKKKLNYTSTNTATR